MGRNSAIQWCDDTFNPWVGCAAVSPGCKNCYAESLMDTRLGRVKWGVYGTRSRTSDSYWTQPYKWNLQAEEAGRKRRVFCASLADVFEDRPELAPWRKDLFRMIEETPHLEWLLLTKRPRSVARMMGRYINTGKDDQYLRNVRIGVSVEDQKRLFTRAFHFHLLDVPNFLSVEPLLEEVDLFPDGAPTYDWVIVGGESGPNARPFCLEWAESIVEQCREREVPVFVKQMGSNPRYRDDKLVYRDKKGGAPDEWPPHLRVRQFPEVAHASR